MSTTIKLKRGTRTNLDSLATNNSLVAGEPILITDENRLAVATGVSTYETFAKVSEIPTSYTDLVASFWVSDTTYTDYLFKCDINIAGVTSSDVAEIIFAHAEAISGNYSPVCLTATDKVTIYSKVNTTITIPTILINKQS